MYDKNEPASYRRTEQHSGIPYDRSYRTQRKTKTAAEPFSLSERSRNSSVSAFSRTICITLCSTKSCPEAGSVEVTLPGYLYAPFVLNDNPVRAEIPHDLVAGKRGIGLPVGLPLVHKRERMSQFPPTDNRLGRRAARRTFFAADCVAGKRGKISLPRSGTDFQSNRTLPGKQPAEIELRPVAKYSDRQSQRNLTFVTFDPVERIGRLKPKLKAKESTEVRHSRTIRSIRCQSV